MIDPTLGSWTRRRLLKTLPAMLAPWVIPANLLAAAKPAKTPFSRFVDVTESAGLTEVMYYGDPNHNTYIIEVNGTGCAFFDYDNDGWMDAFILGGRRLEGIPPGSSNRLYRNNRDGTFTDVTAKAGLIDAAGRTEFASAITTTTASKTCILPTTARTSSIAITATEHLPTLQTRLDCTILVSVSVPVARSSTTTATVGSICSSPTTSTSISPQLRNLPLRFPIATSRASRRTAVRAASECHSTVSTATMGMELLPMFPRKLVLRACVARTVSPRLHSMPTRMVGRTSLSPATRRRAFF